MGKKLFTWLAPLLGIVAFAVVPAAAQAASPHFYVNGSLLAEGEKEPVIAWGRLTLESEPPATKPVTCENAAGGFAENPAGGGAGKGQTTRFATWNCADEECPAGKITIGGTEFEKEFEVISPPQDLPWANELIPGTGTKTKLNSTGVVVTLGCYAHTLTKSEAEKGSVTGPGENEQFPLAAPVRCETTATHLQDPENINGSNQGNLQSTLVFNQPAGSGLTCASGAVTGRTTGTLKTMGYASSALITVKTP